MNTDNLLNSLLDNSFDNHNIHVRLQKRNGKKSITTIEYLDKYLNDNLKEKVLKLYDDIHDNNIEISFKLFIY